MSLAGILVIAVIILVLFGGRRLPDMGRRLGKTVGKLRSKIDKPGDS